MKVIAIVNNKGGVGKTTSAQNIGAGLAKFADARVLIVDLDEQASLTKSFGISHEKLVRISGSYILNEHPFDECVIKTDLVDILPSSKELRKKEDSIKSAPTFPFNLKKALAKISDRYDFVILDCPPALSGLTTIALVACDLYFVPLQAEYLSYEGLRSFLQYSSEIQEISPSTNLGGVFATRYNPKTKRKLSNDLIINAKEQLGDSFMNHSIRDNIAISEAQAMGKCIFEYAPESNGSADYFHLVKEIISRL